MKWPWHVHDWDKWRVTEKFDARDYLNKVKGKAIQQERNCKDCGKTQIDLRVESI